METNGSNSTCVLHEHDDYKFDVYAVVYSLVFVIGLILNLIALFEFVRLTPRRTVTTIYLINLAISDLCFVILLPLRIYYYTTHNWIFGDVLCRITYSMFYVNMYCSIFFLTGLSVFRYLAIVHPIRSRNSTTSRRAIISCATIWLFVVMISSPFLKLGEYQLNNATRCFEADGKDELHIMLILNYLAVIVGLFLPFVTIVFCYVSIVKVLRRRKKHLAICQSTLRMIASILVVFAICFIPYHIQRTLYVHISSDYPNDCELQLTMQKGVVATVSFAAFNSCLDPFIYFFASEKFRNRFFDVLHKLNLRRSKTPATDPHDVRYRDTQVHENSLPVLDQSNSREEFQG
uniref:cysteinyl leukotriene receptor 1-like n=1 Tax=Myxine glutinosa TaxID=7769 RepID=UPI00358E4D05